MNMDGVVMLFALGSALAFGAWTRSIAVKKGYSGGFFVLGFFFLLIGVFVAACLTDKTLSHPVKIRATGAAPHPNKKARQ